jgi:hypothetical protein
MKPETKRQWHLVHYFVQSHRRRRSDVEYPLMYCEQQLLSTQCNSRWIRRRTCSRLFALFLAWNSQRRKNDDFNRRVSKKSWLTLKYSCGGEEEHLSMYQASHWYLNPRTPAEETKFIVERLEDKLEGCLVTLRSERRRCLINLDKPESFHQIDITYFQNYAYFAWSTSYSVFFFGTRGSMVGVAKRLGAGVSSFRTPADNIFLFWKKFLDRLCNPFTFIFDAYCCYFPWGKWPDRDVHNYPP